MIEQMLETNINNDDVEINLDVVDNETYSKLIAFYEYNHDKSNTLSDIEHFNNEFVNCSQKMLFKLLNASDYLECTKVLDLCSQKMADEIKLCKSLDEIKKKYDITHILSNEEETELDEFCSF